MKLFCVILLVVSALSDGGETGNQAADNKFELGYEYYLNGQFPEAAMAYQSSATALPSVGALLNAGICEWQRGHAGAAILAWEQARWIDPFDPRAGVNLKFARQVAQVDAPQLKWFETASTWLPPDVWVWLAGASLWLAVGALVLPGFFRRKKSNWQQALAALGLGVFLASMTANIGTVSRTQTGFVVKKNAPLRLTPTRDGEVMATLTAGEPARRERTRGNYFFIRTAGGSGWIEQGDFRLICP